jgi:hypothetical protein
MSRLNRVLVAVVALGTAAGGAARAEKFAYHADAHPSVELSARSKPRAASGNAAPTAPAIDADTLLDAEALVDNIRDEEAATLSQLIASSDDSDSDRPEYYFRLAELRARQYRTAHMVAIRAQMGKGDKSAAAPAKDETAALDAALHSYAALTNNAAYRSYAKMDVALFYFAYTLNLANRGADARAVFDRLLREHPGSRFAPDAHLAFADYYFRSNQLEDAETRYRKVVAIPTASQRWYAQYMLGWIALERRDAQTALEAFFAVAQALAGNAKQDVLRRAALHDFVRAYAEIGKVDQAPHAFARVDAAAAPAMLEQLADLYIDEGKADRAIAVLRGLMKARPRDPAVCRWQHDVAREMLVAGSRGDQVHEIAQLVALSGVLAKANTLAAADLAECRDSAAEMAGQYARAFHQEAAKTRNVELAGAADALYASYLAGFPAAADVGETAYYRAELAWLRGEMEKEPRRATQAWEDAAAAFTAALDTGKLDARLTKEAADAAMQAWMRALAVDPRVATTPQPVADDDARYKTIPKPQPLPAAEQHLLAAYERYLAAVTDPRDDERVDVIFLRAQLLYRHDHLADAIAGFEDVLAHHRDNEAAESAAQLALDTYNLLHRYDDMFALVARLEADKPFLAGKDRLVGVLTKLQRQGRQKQADLLAETARKGHDNAAWVAAGDAYLAIYNDDPLASEAATALDLAARSYETGKSLGLALSLYEQLRRLFPNTALAERALARLGDIYADVAFYRQAAEKLEAYAQKYAGEGDAYTALSNAVAYRKGIGDDAQAIADTERFVQLFGASHPGDAANAAWSLVAIYDKLGDADRLGRALRDYLAHHADHGGADRVVAAWQQLGDVEWKASCPVGLVDGTCAKRVPARPHARHASCSEVDAPTIAVVPRDPTRVARAMAAYAHAVEAFDQRHGKTGGDERGALYYYASAKLGLAEKDFEVYLASAIPVGLDFAPRDPALAKRSRARFEAWYASKGALGGSVRARYEAVIELHDGATAIAAAARLGQLPQSFAEQLLRADVPHELRDSPYADDVVPVYCDALAERAEPLIQSAEHSYEVCLQQSQRLSWFGPSSQMCERELGELDPSHYPTALELRRTPDEVGMIKDVEPAAVL